MFCQTKNSTLSVFYESSVSKQAQKKIHIRWINSDEVENGVLSLRWSSVLINKEGVSFLRSPP